MSADGRLSDRVEGEDHGRSPLVVDVLTAFPEMFPGPLAHSVAGRALERGVARIRARDLREFTEDRHRTVDDAPYGGGAGMVLMARPVVTGVRQILAEQGQADSLVIMPTPRGTPFSHREARRLAERSHLVFICGHYKGMDERVRDILGPVEISLGDYVLSGGELATMVIIDAVLRLVPGTLGNFESAETDSFYDALLEAPLYTRPQVFEGRAVPDVLLSGNHASIRRWRRKEALRLTRRHRPELLDGRVLTPEERTLIREIEEEERSLQS